MAHEKTVYPADFSKSCSNCKFGETIVKPQSAESFTICRQQAPRSQAQCIGVDPANGQAQWRYTTLWPVVGTQDWCGQYAAKLQS
jgi:hypothetical protein